MIKSCLIKYWNDIKQMNKTTSSSKQLKIILQKEIISLALKENEKQVRKH